MPDTDAIRPRWLPRLVLIALLTPRLAMAADPPRPDPVLAETLFRQGKELMAAKQFGAACPKLAESYQLDPGTGTLLALALCHEGEGRIATAWVELTDVLAASGDARPDRAQLARDRLAVLEPELSKLTVVVPAPLADVPGLEIRRDGVRLDRPAWGTAVPIDGGAHTIDARAPLRRAWSLRFDVTPRRDRRVVDVPLLAPEVSSSRDAPGAAVTDAPPSQGPDVARQRWGIVVGSIGLVGVGVGTYFGVTALSKIHDAKAECPTAPNCTSAAAVSTSSEGHRDATISDVAIGAGVAAGLVGIVLVLTGRAPSRASALRVVPSVDRFGGTVTIGRAF